MKFVLAILFFLIGIGSYAHAVDLYTLIDKSCHSTQGLIINVTEETTTVLTLEGEEKVLNKSEINYIVIHGTIDNPFKVLHVKGLIKSLARDVYITNQDKPDFVGWPIRFLENLVVFYDFNGKTQVIDQNQILKIRDFSGSPSDIELGAKNLDFNYGDLGTQCKDLPKSNRGIRFSRLIGDKIQIDEFFHSFEVGFQALNDFQERTFLYAKPQIYPQSVRLGFPIFNSYMEAPKPILPFYVQASSGLPYHFQSFTQLGGSEVEWTPTLQPQFLLRSEAKSHIFHASFVGNVLALSAGANYFRQAMHQDNDGLVNDIAQTDYLPSDSNFTGISFNYMAFIGVDYGPWSLSYGTIYPVYLFYSRPEYREVTGDDSSPIYRIEYTVQNFKIYALYSPIQMLKGNTDPGSNIYQGLKEDWGQQTKIDSASVDSHFFRIGADYTILPDLSVGGAYIFNEGKYNEAKTIGISTASYSFTHTSYELWVDKQFSDYVNLKIVYQLYNFHEGSNLSGVNLTSDKSKSQFGGYFEFIF